MIIDLHPLPDPRNDGKLSNYDIMFGVPIPPIDRLSLFSSGQFENMVREWAIGYLRQNGSYISCSRCSGAGDKGRDVVGIIDDNRWDNFQCKHYDHPLAPTDIYIEIGKLLYYTFSKAYSNPRKYFFISPKGLGAKLNDYFSTPVLLKKEVKENWRKYCENHITDQNSVPLSGTFATYVDQFDYSIFNGYDPLQLIEEHKKTAYYASRFGGGLQKPRPLMQPISNVVGMSELVYTSKLLDAYSDYKKKKLKSVEELEQFQDLASHFFRQREGFFSADSLYQFSRDSFPPEIDYFNEIKEEFLRGVIDVANADYKDGYECVRATTNFAKLLQLGHSPLVNHLNMKDRDGICHHLANENKLSWVKK